MMDRTTAAELLGAYALDALSPEETAEVERLLRDWPDGRAEVAGLLGAAQSLAALAEPAAPPAALERRVLGLAAGRRRLPSLAFPQPLRARRWQAAGAWAAAMTVLAVVFGVLNFQGEPDIIGGVWVDVPGIEGAQAYTVEFNDQPAALILRDQKPPGPAPEGSQYWVWRILADGTIKADKPFALSPKGWGAVVVTREEGVVVTELAYSVEPIGEAPPAEPSGDLVRIPLE